MNLLLELIKMDINEEVVKAAKEEKVASKQLEKNPFEGRMSKIAKKAKKLIKGKKD